MSNKGYDVQQATVEGVRNGRVLQRANAGDGSSRTLNQRTANRQQRRQTLDRGKGNGPNAGRANAVCRGADRRLDERAPTENILSILRIGILLHSCSFCSRRSILPERKEQGWRGILIGKIDRITRYVYKLYIHMHAYSHSYPCSRNSHAHSYSHTNSDAFTLLSCNRTQ